MSIPRLTGFQSNDFVRPSDEIDPGLKQSKPDYALAWCKFIYSQFLRGNTFIKETDTATIDRNRKYAAGKQDSDIYKSKFLHESGRSQTEPDIPVVNKTTGEISQKAKREGWVDMNFDDIFSPIPKYVQNIIGIMEQQEHDVTVSAIDEQSGSLREEIKYTFFAKEKLAATLTKFDKVFNIPSVDENIPMPKSLQELEMLSKMGLFKLPYEIGIKKAIRDSDSISNIKKIKRMVIRDLITIGKSAVWTFVDPLTNRVKHKYADMQNLIVEDTQEEDGTDATYWGYVEYISVADLRAETGWDEQKVRGLAEKWAGRLDNPQFNQFKDTQPGIYGYDTFKIPILVSYWLANDTTYKNYRTLKNGKEVEFDENYREEGVKPPRIRNNEKRRTEKTTIRTMYTAKWCIGSEDAIYNYQKAVDIPYDYANKDVYPLVHIFRIAVKPIIENMIPIEDQIMFTFLRFQNAIIKSPPPGLAIQVSSLRDLKVGQSKWSPLDTIRFYSHTGNLLYELTPNLAGPLSGGHNAGKPFEELRGGLGTAIQDAVLTLEMLYRQLDIISGIDPITSVTKSPTADQGKAVTEMAIAATSNTLKPIYSGYVSIRESMSRAAGLLIQSIIAGFDRENINENPYAKVIGDGYSLAILTAMDYPPCEYGFRMVAKPTDRLKEEIRAMAQLAVQKNVIRPSDFLFLTENLETDDGIKYARMFLAFQEQEYAKKEQEALMQHAQEQNKGVMMAEQSKQQGELQKIKAEETKEIAVIRAKGEEERKTLAMKLKMEAALEPPEPVESETTS